MNELSKTYTWKDAKADSARCKEAYINRFIIKLHRANEQYFGHTVSCLLASAVLIGASTYI